jgi:small subunit ribosomal protein S1
VLVCAAVSLLSAGGVRAQQQTNPVDHKVENPEELVKVGDTLEVKILRVDTDERKIGLSRKRVEWAEEAEAQPAGAAAASPPQELKGGVGKSGPLIGPAEE